MVLRNRRDGDGDEETQPWSQFIQRPEESLQRLRRTGSPLFLTVDGKRDVVVQSADSYDRLLDRIETIEGIQRGLREADEGKTRPASEAIDAVRVRHSIPLA